MTSMWWKLVLVGLALSLTVTDARPGSNVLCMAHIEATMDNPPDEELMNAFYIADPNPKTGQLRFTVHPQKMLQHKMQGKIEQSWLPFNEWRNMRHDARERFEQLWVYISRLVASDVAELYGHFRSESTTTAAPRPIINFDKIKTIVDKGCTNRNNLQFIWPYSCFDSNFFCSWSKGLALLKPILLHSTTTDIDGLTCKANTFKSLAMVNKMSQLAVDSDSRAAALKELFAPAIVSRFAEENLQLPLYQSGLVRNGMFLLVSKTGYRDDVIKRQLQAVKDKITTRCTQTAEQPVGKHYYCLAKKFITKTTECDTAGKASPCIYQSIFQNYFLYGAFIYKSENDTVDMMSVRVGASITALLTSIRDQKSDKLRVHLDSFTPNLDMKEAVCSMHWKKAFRCKNKDFDCFLKTMYRSDCQVQVLIKVIRNLLKEKGSKEWTHPVVKRVYKFTTMWFLYPPFLYSNSFTTLQKKKTIDYFQAEVERVREKFEVPEFRSIRAAVPKDSFVPSWIRRKMCEVENVKEVHQPYCLIAKLVDAVVLVIRTTEGSLGDRFRILHPDIDYTKRFEQLNLGHVSDYLNKQSSIYFDMVSDRLDEIPSYVQQNFGAISSYFRQLANFDQAKTTADLKGVISGLNDYKARSKTVSDALMNKMFVILAVSQLSVKAESIQRAVELVVQIARNANPLSQLYGNTEPLETMGKVAAVAKANVNDATLAHVVKVAYPEFKKKLTELEDNYKKNEVVMFNAKKMVDAMKSTDVDLDDKIAAYLDAYDKKFKPAVSQADITSLAALLTKLVDDCCAAAFAGGTFSSAAVQIGLGSDGKCTDIKGEIQQWLSLNLEIYASQFEMMETIAAVARSKAAQQQAKALSINYTFKSKLDVKFLKSKAIITHLVSSLHLWEMAMQYCNILTYKNNGVQLPVCKTARTTPNKRAIAQLMSHAPAKACHYHADLNIPTKAKSTNAIDYIDMEKLFKGEEITFQIPNYDWLKQNSLFSSSDAEKSFRIHRFQVFLPWYVTGKKLVTIEVKPNSNNKLRLTDRLTYVMKNTHPFTTQYYTSNLYCLDRNIVENPYDKCDKFKKLCMKNKGTRRSTLSPSIYNKWTIKLLDPDGVSPPKSKTDFKIRANIGYCLSDTKATTKRDVASDTKATTKRDVASGEGETMKRRSTTECCSASQYFNGRSCTACPAGSTKHASGFFCN